MYYGPTLKQPTRIFSLKRERVVASFCARLSSDNWPSHLADHRAVVVDVDLHAYVDNSGAYIASFSDAEEMLLEATGSDPSFWIGMCDFKLLGGDQ